MEKELLNLGIAGIFIMFLMKVIHVLYRDSREDAKVLLRVLDFVERLDKRMP